MSTDSLQEERERLVSERELKISEAQDASGYADDLVLVLAAAVRVAAAALVVHVVGYWIFGIVLLSLMLDSPQHLFAPVRSPSEKVVPTFPRSLVNASLQLVHSLTLFYQHYNVVPRRRGVEASSFHPRHAKQPQLQEPLSPDELSHVLQCKLLCFPYRYF